MRVLAEAASPPAPARRRSGDLGLRIASAAILAPVGLAALVSGGVAWRTAIVVGIAGTTFEWATMARRGPAPLVIAGLATGLAFAGGWSVVAAAIGVASAVTFAVRAPVLATGFLYVALPGVALIALRDRHPDGLAVVLLVMLATWASDTGAYAAGRLVGGPKLAPAISPSKTWAGAAGGLAAGGLVGLAFGNALLGGLLAAASQAGDLFESGCKRRFGVKDSGRLIPGHGGLLDRLDGLMAASVLAWAVVPGSGAAPEGAAGAAFAIHAPWAIGAAATAGHT